MVIGDDDGDNEKCPNVEEKEQEKNKTKKRKKRRRKAEQLIALVNARMRACSRIH